MKMRQAIPAQAGFTLLEVLIAVVVLSFGVLGMVGLQAASIQANRDARLQSVAVRLGRELADMMRGNKEVALRATYGFTAATNPYLYDTNQGVYPNPPENCFTLSTGCTSTTTVAAWEMKEWLTRVGADTLPGELPGVRVVVCFDSNPYDANGRPQWDCNNAGAGTNGTQVLKMGWTRVSTKRDAAASDALVLATAPTVILPLIPGLLTP